MDRAIIPFNQIEGNPISEIYQFNERENAAKPTDNTIIKKSSDFVGMEFEMLEKVDEFWAQYTRNNGFGGRIRGVNKSSKDGAIISKTYLCSKAGLKCIDKRRINSKPRAETRCECSVKLVVCLSREKGNYYIKTLIENHNHLLEGKQTVHLLRAHRDINEIQACVIDIASRAGQGPTTTFRYMRVEAGGSDRVGFTIEEIKSHLRTKRLKNLNCGEATAILKYFDTQSNLNPFFFRRFQFDCDGLITNFFWADPKMMTDYQAFGDVVTFDTTFGTNKESRPLGIFAGYNNHKQTVIFGGALLYDETTESLAWVFNIFLECHGGKVPGIIFTDQDPTMKKAIPLVMPDVQHGLCSWHLCQNAIKNLAKTLGNQWHSFYCEFIKCMHEYLDVDLFEQKWENMLNVFHLIGNSWLGELYTKKKQWSRAYMKNVFTAGISSTQLSECVNSMLKRVLGGGMSMEKFFIGFDLFLTDVRDTESKSDCNSRQSFPHIAAKNSFILRQAAKIYTPNIYHLFYNEWDLEHGISLDNYWGSLGTPHVRVARHGNKSYEINIDPSTMTFSCSCCRFEMCGYLCSHILRVFHSYDISEIPEHYILKRWTIYAKNGLAFIDPPSPNLTEKQKFDFMCSGWLAIARRACHKKVPFDLFVRRFMNEAHTFIDQYVNHVGIESSMNDCSSIDHSGIKIHGLKKKETTKSGRKRRFKSCLEKGKTGKKAKKTDEQVIEPLLEVGSVCTMSQVIEGHINGEHANLLRLSLNSCP